MFYRYTFGLLLLSVVTSIKCDAQSFVLAPQFGVNGLVTTVLPGAPWTTTTKQGVTAEGWLVLGANVVYGDGGNRFVLRKLDAYCGSPDATFGVDGTVNFGFGYKTALYDMAVLDDGRIVVVGSNSTGNGLSEIKPTIFMFLPDGTPDLSFNGTGYNKVDLWPPSADIGSFFSVLPTADGKIYAVGKTIYDPGFSADGVGVMRFNLDGSLDQTYSDDGIAWMAIAGIDARGSAVLLPNGKIQIAGMGGGNLIHMFRFNADGSTDTDYGINGTLATGVTGYAEFIEILAQPDGKVLLNTDYDTFGPSPSAYLVRYLVDGTVDTSYGVDGGSAVAVGGNGASARGTVLDAAGNSYQTVFSYGGSPSHRNLVIKRDPVGQVVTTFGTNGLYTIPTYFLSMFDISLPDADHILLSGGWDNGPYVMRLTTSLAAEDLITLGPDVTACTGTSVDLEPSYFAGQSIQWTGGSTEPILPVNTGGTYTATAFTIGGCTDSDEVLVSFAAPATPVVTFNGAALTTTASGTLQWFLNDEPIVGAGSNSWVPVSNGSYTVEVGDANDCTAISDPYMFLSMAVGDALDVVEPTLRYDPMQRRIFILSNGQPVASILMIDPSGRLVSNTPVNTDAGLSTEGLAQGMYTVRVVMKSGKEMVQRFVL